MKQLILLVTVLSLRCIPCTAQKTTTDTAKPRASLNAASVAPDSATLQQARQTLLQSMKTGDRTKQTNALLSIGSIYNERGEYQQSIGYYKQALSLSSSALDTAECYKRIGNIYLLTGEYVLASDNFFKALALLEKHNIVQPISVDIYSSLALVNFHLTQTGQAYIYLKKAEGIARKGGFDLSLTSVLNNFGGYFSNLAQYDSARKYLTEEMEIGKRIGDISALTASSINLAQICIALKEYEKAISYLQSVIALTENKYPRPYISASYSLGGVMGSLGKYREGEEIILHALKIGTALQLKKDNLKGYHTLCELYTASGQYKKAMDCMDSIMIIRDSIAGAEKAKTINQMEIKYKTAEKDKQIAGQNSEIARQKMWIAMISGGVVALLLVSIGLYLNSRNKQRLQTERIKALEQEQKIRILKAAVQSEDNERSRIARELHDGIGGMLSAAMMRLSATDLKSETTTAVAFGETMSILADMGKEIRKTAHNLMPEVLLKQSLPEAVRIYCKNLEKEDSLQIDFQSYGSFDTLTESFKLNVYRIVQELLKNIVQHAHADHALAELTVNENILAITVEDNGMGFDTTQVKNGIGLHNVQTRVGSLDGRLQMESAPGKGTFIFIEFDIT